MRVGNIEVEAVGEELRVKVHGCKDGYFLIFTQPVHSKYDGLLREQDVYAALRRGRKEMQRDVLDALEKHHLPGTSRGKLRRAIDAVKSIYGL